MFFGNATAVHEDDPNDALRLAQRLVVEAMKDCHFDGVDDGIIRVAIHSWNDQQRERKGHQRVLAAFDKAIAEAKRLEAEAEKALAEEFALLPVMIQLSPPEVIEEPCIELPVEQEMMALSP